MNNNKRSGKANIISDKAAEWEPQGVRILAQAAVCALIRCVCCVLSYVWLFVTPRTAACEVSLSMGLSRQEYQGGWPCPPPGDLAHPGTGPASLHRPVASLHCATREAWGRQDFTILRCTPSAISRRCFPSWWPQPQWLCLHTYVVKKKQKTPKESSKCEAAFK